MKSITDNGDNEQFLNNICSYRACNVTLCAGYRAALFNVIVKKNNSKSTALDLFVRALDINTRNGLEALENLIIWYLFDSNCYCVTANYNSFSVYYDESFKKWLNQLGSSSIYADSLSVDCMFTY